MATMLWNAMANGDGWLYQDDTGKPRPLGDVERLETAVKDISRAWARRGGQR